MRGRSQIDMEQSHRELHDLCQPLTALRCRLEISRMQGQEAAFADAIDESLEQTQRMFDVVARMRQRLQRIEQTVEQEIGSMQQRGWTGEGHGDSESQL